MTGLQVLALILCAVGIIVGLMGLYSCYLRIRYPVDRFIPLRPRATVQPKVEP